MQASMTEGEMTPGQTENGTEISNPGEEAWVMGQTQPVSSEASGDHQEPMSYQYLNRSTARKVRLCPDTGEKAGPYCPNTFAAAVDHNEGIGSCSFHRPQEGSARQRGTNTDPLALEQEAWGSYSPQG